jgi:dTDP-4-amino-4,6-dideoxygalactose transaminase
MASAAQIRVPMLDLKAQYETIAAEIDEAIRGVLVSQHFIQGPEVQRLESEIASYCECAFAIGCASGSDALLLALMAYGIGPGDEVVTTPFTFFATAGAIVRLGARPVFVDIEESSFNFDAARFESVVTERTRAVVPVHLFGQCADMSRVNDVAAGRGIAVIEDAAQAIGAEYRGARAGSLGSVSAFSFYPSKNLGGAGDGGMITTDDPELADRLRVLRSHGARKKYYHELVGINSRLDAFQAAILRVKLRYLDEWARARRLNAQRYTNYFRESGLGNDTYLRLPSENAESLHVYNQFVIRVDRRNELKSFLAEHGVGTEIYYPLPLHLQICFVELGYKEGDFPESERASQEVLALPIYPELTESHQQYVVDMIAAFFKGRGRQ